MTKAKIMLTASAFMLAIGAVFAANLAPEPGYYFDASKPVGQRCVQPSPAKNCQNDDQTTPLCTAIVSGTPKQLYRFSTVDQCQSVPLHEIQ